MGHPNVEMFLSQIEHEIFKEAKTFKKFLRIFEPF